MAVHHLHDQETGQSALIDTTTDVAFGPLFERGEDPEDFLEWLRDNGTPDPRLLLDHELSIAVLDWRLATEGT